MISELQRDLAILMDNQPVSGFRHARLSGIATIGLYPMPFILRLWNLAESDYHLLSSAKEVSVLHGDSILAG